jgi:hypothetical protein
MVKCACGSGQLGTPLAVHSQDGQVQSPPAAPATRHPAGSVRSEWSSARPLAFPEEGDAEGVPSALARGIIHKWFEANHWVAIDGVAGEDVEQ